MSLIAPLLIAFAALLVAAHAHRGAARDRARATRYATLAANLPDVTVMVYDRDRRLTLIEGPLIEQMGWRRDELLGRPLGEIVPAERHAELLPRCDAALGGQGSGHEWDGLRGGARYRLEHVPLRDGAMIVFRDITETLRLQRVADAERGFLEAVLDQLSDSVVACDADGRLRVGDVAGVGLGPLDWPSHFGLRRADGRVPLMTAEVPLFRALNGERVDGEELLIEETTGALRHVIVTARPVADAHGRLLGAVSTSIDVTDRRAAEEQLRAGEERLRSVVESVGDTVFQTDLRGRWTFLNERFADWTGIPVESAIGRPVSEVVHPDDRAAHARAFAPLISGRTEEVRHRHRYVTAAGVTRWAEVRARLARDADGHPHGAAGVIEDVTARHRSRQYDAAEQAIVDVLMRADDLDTGVSALLESLCHHLDWDLAELWTYDADAGALRCTDAAGERRAGLEALEAAREGRALEIGDGLPGQAWARRTPIWVSTLPDDPLFCRGPEAAAAGIASALAVPIARGGEVLAAILFLGREQREPDPGLNRLLGAVGAHLAQFLERRRVERELYARTSQLSELSRLTRAVLGR